MSLILAILLSLGFQVQRLDTLIRATYTVQRANCPETISIASFNGRLMVDVDTYGQTRRYYLVTISRRGTAVYLSENEKDFAVVYPGGFDLIKTNAK